MSSDELRLLKSYGQPKEFLMLHFQKVVNESLILVNGNERRKKKIHQLLFRSFFGRKEEQTTTIINNNSKHISSKE